VFRLRLQSEERVLAVVAKRMDPDHARRNALVIRRWMPEMGLADVTPALLGVSASADGRWVWHVYEDLGAHELQTREPDRARVEAAARQIAALHTRCAEHPLLAECRVHGLARGADLFATTVRDALHALEALRPPHVTPGAADVALRDRLISRLGRLLAEAPVRARAIADWGGPETLQHGDLWATNTFVEPVSDGVPDGLRVRFIDWDRAGVGSASYDLSTFLLRFAPEHRGWIVAAYREALGPGGWRMPGRDELNLLFETDELSRYANRLIWPALALHRENAAWGFDELAAVEGWFGALEPVLPEEIA
jgi:hypothetical protein